MWARRTTSSPTRIGQRKSRLSTATVTTWARAWRCAAIAPAISIRCITLPPSMFPSGLASLGSTTSTVSAADSATVFPWSFAMLFNLQNVKSRCDTRPPGGALGGRASRRNFWFIRGQARSRSKSQNQSKIGTVLRTPQATRRSPAERFCLTWFVRLYYASRWGVATGINRLASLKRESPSPVPRMLWKDMN